MSNELINSYLPIFIFIIIASILSVIMIILPFLLGKIKGDKEKLSA